MKQPESMAHSIRLRLVLVGVVSIALTVLLTALLFQRAFAAQADTSLARTVSAVAAGYQAEAAPQPQDLAKYLRTDENAPLRITLVAADGTVLYDSTGTAGLENHLSRPEIQAALATGEGAATRQSATLGYETHYRALRLADGSVLRLAMDTRSIWAAYNSALPLLALCCALVLALAWLVSVRLTRSLIAPIEQMGEHLDQIEARVPYTELEPLAKTLQTDRRLQEENETMRREFTANVSHELKTPLTSISGYAELIENGMAKPEDTPAFAARIHKEASRMIALVSDIIQLTELDEMRAVKSDTPEFAPVDLAALVKETAACMTMNARKAYVTLQYKAEPATVTGSRDQLAELLTNLCDNAIRYNRPGGHVLLTSGAGPDGLPCLSVEDTGIGIPREAQNRVFERFYRVDKSRSKATGGTGLGLAIVKHIALLHSARIELKSQVGTGTVIQVIFPRV